MFTTPKVNVISSSEGYSVVVLGRTGLTYKEGNKSMKIDSEILAGPSGVIIYTDSINAWDEPNGSVIIREQDRDRITSNIVAAFKFRGYDIEVN